MNITVEIGEKYLPLIPLIEKLLEFKDDSVYNVKTIHGRPIHNGLCSLVNMYKNDQTISADTELLFKKLLSETAPKECWVWESEAKGFIESIEYAEGCGFRWKPGDFTERKVWLSEVLECLRIVSKSV